MKPSPRYVVVTFAVWTICVVFIGVVIRSCELGRLKAATLACVPAIVLINAENQRFLATHRRT